VKAHAGAAQPERLAVFLGIADNPDLGLVRQIEFGWDHDVQRAEPAGERDMICGRHLKVAKMRIE
jgi:hypothetical protein